MFSETITSHVGFICKMELTKEEIKNPLLYIPKYFKVLSKATKAKPSMLVPMVLWPIQEYYVSHRTNRNICLKNRQTGFSTAVLADNAHALFTHPFERQSIITHEGETSSFLLMTVDRFWQNLPKDMRPRRSWGSGRRMRFPDTDSYIYIDSAQADAVGIGRGLTRAHLSEVAKWPATRAKDIFADISQTIPEGGVLTIESTPKGRWGLFYDLYQAAKRKDIDYSVFFFPW